MTFECATKIAIPVMPLIKPISRLKPLFLPKPEPNLNSSAKVLIIQTGILLKKCFPIPSTKKVFLPKAVTQIGLPQPSTSDVCTPNKNHTITVSLLLLFYFFLATELISVRCSGFSLPLCAVAPSTALHTRAKNGEKQNLPFCPFEKFS